MIALSVVNKQPKCRKYYFILKVNTVVVNAPHPTAHPTARIYKNKGPGLATSALHTGCGLTVVWKPNLASLGMAPGVAGIEMIRPMYSRITLEG